MLGRRKGAHMEAFVEGDGRHVAEAQHARGAHPSQLA